LRSRRQKILLESEEPEELLSEREAGKERKGHIVKVSASLKLINESEFIAGSIRFFFQLIIQYYSLFETQLSFSKVILNRQFREFYVVT
jgi:hypothetical protein